MKRIIEGKSLIRSAPGVLLLFALAVYFIGLASLSASPKAADAGTLFAKHCATCHGKNGEARTFKAKFNHARNLTDSSWQTTVTDERLFNSITNGRGRMPAWGKQLSEEEINTLVAYIRQLKR